MWYIVAAKGIPVWYVDVIRQPCTKRNRLLHACVPVCRYGFAIGPEHKSDPLIEVGEVGSHLILKVVP